MNATEMKCLRDWFHGCVHGYPDADPDGREAYALKIEHSLRVTEHCVALGKSLNFDGGDLFLAEAVGLCHDIGRFEQFRRWHTFMDGKSENHARLGVRVLKENNALSMVEEEERQLILTAVSCHNMLSVPADLSPREDTFCRLIRDADKIDIMRVVSDYYESGKKSPFIELNLPDEPGWTEAILDDLFHCRLVDMRKMRTLNDFKLLQLGWSCDLNFPYTARVICEEGYLKKIRKSLPASDVIDALLERLRLHLKTLILKT
jgi:HD superfamily phosphohydrolase YqeK